MKKITLSQAFDGFILDKQAASKSANTIRNYRVTFSKVELWLKTTRPDDPDPYFADLARQDWVAFMAWLRDDYISACEGVARREPRPLSQKSLLNIHTDLCALYTWAISPGIELATTHIFHTIERPEADTPVIEMFTREQIRDMLKACKESRAWHNREDKTNERSTADRDQAIILLLLSTGIRASELCDIRLRDIDMTQRSITVAGKGRGQGKKQRVVHFGKSTGRALWRYLTPQMKALKQDDTIFTVGPEDAPRSLTRDVLWKLVHRIGERAGVEANPHKFRHTFATHYLRNGGDLFTLQALLGHTSLEMVQRYAKIVSADCAREHEKADPVDNWRL
jgi:integrase/recombinase XerD